MITLNSEDNTCADHFTKYIYINKNSLSEELCLKIINKYENSNEKFPGSTHGGVNKKVKYTNDLLTKNSDWDEINVTLINELKHNINTYTKLLHNDDYNGINNNTDKSILYDVINVENITHISQFMVQKYDKNVGRYVYHNDHSIKKDGHHRALTYLWYLNDVTEGGETTFSGIYNIKPKRGTLILFPSCWTFPHCGKMPLSNDKYIITGWIYVSASFEEY
jgi:hypothetical protein